MGIGGDNHVDGKQITSDQNLHLMHLMDQNLHFNYFKIWAYYN